MRLNKFISRAGIASRREAEKLIQSAHVTINGNVELRTVNQENDILYGDNLVWNINEYEYELTGNIRFENTNILLLMNRR